MEIFVRGHKANLAALTAVVSAGGGESFNEPYTKMLAN